jgi:hypothetical protein
LNIFYGGEYNIDYNVCYSTGRAQAFLSESDAEVSQEVADGKISIQSACALNTR